MERAFESLLLGLRWLLLPLYLALLLTVLAIYVVVGRELWEIGGHLDSVNDVALVVVVCSVLDLVLVANLLVMVAVSSYESYIAPIGAHHASKPEWVGKLDSGNVKVKVAVSVAMISAIHLLRAYLEDEPPEKLIVLSGVHGVFVLSMLGLALVDRTARHGSEPLDPGMRDLETHDLEPGDH